MAPEAMPPALSGDTAQVSRVRATCGTRLGVKPVKRQLVSRPQDWIWSSYGDYAGIRQGALPIDREFLPMA